MLQVDVFTREPLNGNPCAVVMDADDLTSEEMQAIAREMNLSETAFVFRSEIADVKARYFTPAEEIPLAGHPTIATAWALVDTGRITPGTSISLELRDGPVPVEIRADGHIVMTQRKPRFQRIYEAAEVAPAFGLEVADIRADVPLQTVNIGVAQLMIPLRDQEALRRVIPDFGACAELKSRGDFFSAHLFCMAGFTNAGDTSSRHFGLPPDTFEDPFTGSATGNMGAYLWHNGLIEMPELIAEQGHWMHRPGTASVEVVGPPEDIETVRVGGPAVTVLRGTLTF